MKKILLTIALVYLSTFLFTSPALAQSTCQRIYGGGSSACIQSAPVSIDKKVRVPGWENADIRSKYTNLQEYVDNLSINDPKYFPNDTITFQTTVKNTGTTALSNIKVQDIFPDYIAAIPEGRTYDVNSKTLTLNIDKLNPNESKTFTTLGKVATYEQLPGAQNSTICVINRAVATVSDKTSQDNVQFCMEKRPAVATAANITVSPTPTNAQTRSGLSVYPAPQTTKTPSTGPEALALAVLFPLGFSGLKLRSFTTRMLGPKGVQQ